MKKKERRLRPEDVNPRVRTANYFEVVPGARWGEREVDDPELILIVAGRFLYERAGEASWVLEPGDVLFIPPVESHTFRHAEDGSRGVIGCIHCEFTTEGAWRQGGYRLDPDPSRITHTLGDPIIRDLFKRCSELFSRYSPYREDLLQAMVREIWLRMAECWDRGPDRTTSLRVCRMESFLRERLAEPVGRRELADAFSITPEHVNALFKKELGITPTEFVHRERVHLAYRALANEGLSVKEAAVRVGFNDAFYFSKIFKRITGVSPSQVRAGGV